MGQISPDYYVQDGVIPRTRLPEVLREIEQLGEKAWLSGGECVPCGGWKFASVDFV